MGNRESIESSLRTLVNMGYATENISKNIIKITSEHNNAKYILFEPSEIYTSVSSMVDFLSEINDAGLEEIEVDRVLRMPFFAGCSGFDLANFLLPESQISLDVNLECKIHFNILPADFNMIGCQRLFVYLHHINKQRPIYKGLNNFESYLEYFKQILIDNNYALNLVLPVQILPMFSHFESTEIISAEMGKVIEEHKSKNS